MLDTVRLYFETTVAVATMAMLAIISGFVAFALAGDRTLAFFAAAAAFVLSGLVLIFRLWRMTRRPVLPPDPAA